MTVHDLVISNVHLRTAVGSWWLGISSGRIAAISSERLEGIEVIDAGGGLVTESFVNAHLHLDKVHTVDRAGEAALAAYTTDTMAGAAAAITQAAAVKDYYDETWIEANARRVLLDGLGYGVRHVLAFADVDTRAQLKGVKPLLKLREEFRGMVDLQVVAFPQEGLLRDPGADEYVRHAMDLGADVVGGIPWIEASDAEMREHVRRMCALASERGKRVAMLVDDTGDATLRTTVMLAEAILQHGLAGRGVALHARAVGLYPGPAVLRLTELARRARLGFVSDPHTGSIHFPVRRFIESGLDVALGQDDIEDAYYPLGRHNLLEVAFLGAHLLGMTDDRGLQQVFDLVTTSAARVLGIANHVLRVGGSADLVVHEDATVRGVLSRHAAPRYVIASGQVAAVSESRTQLRLPRETSRDA
ncbi:MAG: amidohydrolase family protein [Candidatus Dormibacteraeota bacterium]|nr:amidohydrolase family protein [Candidatus Dormibacteraeota bacterium]